MNEDVKSFDQETNTVNTENPTKEEIENAINSLSMEEIDLLLDDVLKEME